MKLLFENWRRYQKEVLSEEAGDDDLFNRMAQRDKDKKTVQPDPEKAKQLAHIRKGQTQYGGFGITRAVSKKAIQGLKRVVNELPGDVVFAGKLIYAVGEGLVSSIADSTTKEKAEFVAMMADPTGITGHDAAKEQYRIAEREIFQKGDLSYGTAFMLVLSGLGALPILSSLSKGGKLSFKVYQTALKKISKAGPKGVKAANATRSLLLKSLKKGQKKGLRKGGWRKKRKLKPGQTAKVTRMGRVKGLFPTMNPNTGKPLGVFVDKDGRVFVRVFDESAMQPVTFMYSSGTSYQMVDKSGKIVASPRIWTPVGRQKVDGRYEKFLPVGSPRIKAGSQDIPDPRFGKGDTKLYDRLLDSTKQFDPKCVKDCLSWDDKLYDMFGSDWPRRIWSDPKIKDMVEQGIQAGAFRRINRTGLGVGKYPAPDSVFGKLGKKIKLMSPSGNPEDLTGLFGPIKKGVKDGDLNDWVKGKL
jgi:hypothetical protein